ncbi:multisensor hybrid histidine kinase [Roseobacter sp. AzwK-3b]|nr:multisensor hybrid histidine kinase [Roseobacter sp. AzwK-3b]
MLILLLSSDLRIDFVSPDAIEPFAPNVDCLRMPLEAAAHLLRVDPGLPLGCDAVLNGRAHEAVQISPSDGRNYLRRIAPQRGLDGKIHQLVVSYESGDLEPILELNTVRRRLRHAMDAISDPVAYFDREDRLVICNRAYSQLHMGSEGAVELGMTFEAILRRDIANGALDIATEAQEAWLAERLSSRRKSSFELELRLQDGRWFRVAERGAEDGGRVHVLTDITTLKGAQIYLRNVMKGSQVGTWHLDLTSGEGTINSYWADMLGYDRDALMPMRYEDWRELVHPDDLPSMEKEFQTCLAGKAKNWEVEYRLRHLSGRWVWVLSRGGVSEWNSDGSPRQIAGVHLDISKRKALEDELRLRNSAINATPDGITVTDEAGTILDTNLAHARMFGYDSPTDLIGKPWYSLYSSDAAASLAADAFPELRATGKWQGEALALRADGTRFEQELSLAKMPDGKIVCINADVSQRNVLERSRLELRDRVQRAQRQEISNLLSAGLTHDLFNLTTIILHMSDPLYLQSKGIQLQDTFADIHRAAREVIGLLEPIRDLGQRQTQIEDTDFCALLKNAAELLKLGAPPDLVVNIRLPKAALQAEVDPMQIMQILLNLGLNARDALEGDIKEIELSIIFADKLPEGATVEIGQVPAGPFALFTVIDTGTGISEAARKHLWTQGFTTKGQRGTGLGLAVVSEIVKGAGGCIALSTVPDKGSTFWVAWPLDQNIEQAQFSVLPSPLPRRA